jgi:hypothetical protein
MLPKTIPVGAHFMLMFGFNSLDCPKAKKHIVMKKQNKKVFFMISAGVGDQFKSKKTKPVLLIKKVATVNCNLKYVSVWSFTDGLPRHKQLQ